MGAHLGEVIGVDDLLLGELEHGHAAVFGGVLAFFALVEFAEVLEVAHAELFVFAWGDLLEDDGAVFVFHFFLAFLFVFGL